MGDVRANEAWRIVTGEIPSLATGSQSTYYGQQPRFAEVQRHKRV